MYLKFKQPFGIVSNAWSKENFSNDYAHQVFGV